jgi:hypothetical protein
MNNIKPKDCPHNNYTLDSSNDYYCEDCNSFFVYKELLTQCDECNNMLELNQICWCKG